MPGLISSIRSAFLKGEFEAVEQSLIKREETLKRSLEIEADIWKSKFYSMEKKHGEAEIEKLELEDKLKKLEVEVDRAKIEKAKLDELFIKLETVEYENRDKIISLISKNAEFNCANIELRAKNAEFYCANVELRAEIARLKTENTDHDFEAKIESRKKNHAVLEVRVRRLEEKLEIWMDKTEKMRLGNPISDEAITVENLEEEVAGRKSRSSSSSSSRSKSSSSSRSSSKSKSKSRSKSKSSSKSSKSKSSPKRSKSRSIKHRGT